MSRKAHHTSMPLPDRRYSSSTKMHVIFDPQLACKTFTTTSTLVSIFHSKTLPFLLSHSQVLSYFWKQLAIIRCNFIDEITNILPPVQLSNIIIILVASLPQHVSSTIHCEGETYPCKMGDLFWMQCPIQRSARIEDSLWAQSCLPIGWIVCSNHGCNP
jgi:hypothetical protein